MRKSFYEALCSAKFLNPSVHWAQSLFYIQPPLQFKAGFLPGVYGQEE